MKWNPFKKADPKEESALLDEAAKLEAEFNALPGAKDMNMFQRFAMKRVLKMSPEERQKVLQKAMTPKNIEKHKPEILAQLDAMKKAGQMSDDQYRLAKRKLGL
ncbi:MAG: hypothetical protein E6Q06_05270 [Candidatus Moraniibacteriota bacterium]|nr:MAG: hypothetical protein E6Q06_05270 [Candidatus Moranbacteria bacterium]